MTLCSGTLLSMSRLSSPRSKFRFFSVLPQLTYSPVPSLLSCLSQLPLSLCNPLSASSVRLLPFSFLVQFSFISAYVSFLAPSHKVPFTQFQSPELQSSSGPPCSKQSCFMSLCCAYLLPPQFKSPSGKAVRNAYKEGQSLMI